MKRYRYTGYSASGDLVEGILEAADAHAAAKLARQHCRALTGVTPVPAYSFREILNMDMGQLLSSGKLPPKQLSLLCIQLSIGLRAGMPLVRCLELTANSRKEPQLRRLLQDAASDVRSGESLADALEHRNPRLPAAFLQSIRAGEASGTLSDAFRRLGDYYEKQAAVSSAVSAAMLYPAMLILVAIAVVVIILVFAVPVFEETFGRMAASLPLPTAILIGISRFLTKHAFALTALVVCAAMAVAAFARSDRGRMFFAKAALLLPGIGEVNRMQGAAQLSTTLASMLRSGLPLVSALEITAGTLDNPLLSSELRQISQTLLAGETLSHAMKLSKYLPALLTELTAVGEETGALTETLELAAEHYRTEVDTAVKRALSILEPCIILILAMLVVFILLAVYLPIFSMYGAP